MFKSVYQLTAVLKEHVFISLALEHAPGGEGKSTNRCPQEMITYHHHTAIIIR